MPSYSRQACLMHCGMGPIWRAASVEFESKAARETPTDPPYSVLYGPQLHGNHVTFPHSKTEGEEEETGEGDQWRYKDVFDGKG